jgi:hypothetical protein
VIGSLRVGTNLRRATRHAIWVFPWLAGHVILGYLGRYFGSNILPEWIDILAMLVFSLVIYWLALRITMTDGEVAEAVQRDAHQIETA